MSDESISRELEVLLAEYEARGDEIIMFAQRYGRLMMTVFTLLTVTAVVGNLAARGISAPAESGKGVFDWISVFSNILLALPVLVFYLVASTLDTLHMVLLNGLRRGALESAINRIVGKELLVWDKAIIPEVFVKQNFLGRYLWVKPNLQQAFFLLVLMCATFYSLTNLAPGVIKNNCAVVAYDIFLWGTMVFLAYQWAILFGPVGKAMSAQISELSADKGARHE